MDGEVQSDSSAGQGSVTGGQGTSEETLEALKSLTAKVDELNGKIEDNEKSLGQLMSEIGELKSTGGISGIKFGETKVVTLNGTTEQKIKIEDGVKAILFGRKDKAVMDGGGNWSNFCVIQYTSDGTKICRSSYTSEGDLELITKDTDYVGLVGVNGTHLVVPYCFVSW